MHPASKISQVKCTSSKQASESADDWASPLNKKLEVKKLRGYVQHTGAGANEDTQSDGFVGRRPSVLSWRRKYINDLNAYKLQDHLAIHVSGTYLPYTQTHRSQIKSNEEQLGSNSVNPWVLKWFENCKDKEQMFHMKRLIVWKGNKGYYYFDMWWLDSMLDTT
jgi:hypothetical protein